MSKKTNKKTVSYYIDETLDKKVLKMAEKQGVSKNKIVEQAFKNLK